MPRALGEDELSDSQREKNIGWQYKKETVWKGRKKEKE